MSDQDRNVPASVVQPALVLTTLVLNPRHPAVQAETSDLCRMHSRILDATVGMPDAGPRVLWAQPRPDVLAVRACEAVTAARLPRGYATAIHHRPWTCPDQPGRWLMVGVLNPGRTRRLGGPTRNQPDRRRLSGQPLLYTTPMRQSTWLARRLDGARLVDCASVRASTVRGGHRTERTITVRRVEMRAVWQVDDPGKLVDRLHAGVGRDKTWGCGLTLWTRAS
ncbi:type I-E CRISPR-associated protein Cas6/Cse3/CasE [Salinispora arenicola]|uniref:type I-E CRISPR-associated protein Cas6/Cse3/CasE n=1 Tax=Salinispora arenicola TaxID=168697 RepID=UPI0009B7AA35|nr:type I-E CRISPR-associated protein Cas6/Cse3/CasE [Salinispora arenicola]